MLLPGPLLSGTTDEGQQGSKAAKRRKFRDSGFGGEASFLGTGVRGFRVPGFRVQSCEKDLSTLARPMPRDKSRMLLLMLLLL